MDIKQLEDILRYHGIDPDSIPPDKSDFQANEEMASMLLTLLMTEVDALRAEINTLKAQVEQLQGGVA